MKRAHMILEDGSSTSARSSSISILLSGAHGGGAEQRLQLPSAADFLPKNPELHLRLHLLSDNRTEKGFWNLVFSSQRKKTEFFVLSSGGFWRVGDAHRVPPLPAAAAARFGGQFRPRGAPHASGRRLRHQALPPPH